ncbi:MAG: hypothetical protein WC824_15785, partial [Bacteroidota bacterium]
MSRFLDASRAGALRLCFIVLTAYLLPLSACSSEDPPTSTLPPVDSTNTTDSIAYADPVTLCTIQDARLTEISGIAPSRLHGGIYWLHNDSGGEVRLFAVDTTGVTIAACTLDGAVNRDWEDLASVVLNTTAWLYVGDIGDNEKKYPSVTIYRIEEPALQPGWRDSALTAYAEKATFRYPDGAHDCEALMVDPRDGAIVLLEKNGTSCAVYSALWPGNGGDTELQRIAVFRLPFEFSFWRLVTGADLHPASHRVLLRTYNAVLEYEGLSQSPLSALFDSTAARIINTPGLTQPE